MKSEFYNFLILVVKEVNSIALNLSMPKLQEVNDNTPASYMNAIEAAISMYNPQLLICAVPNNNRDRYAAIKKKTCLDKPILTQVIQKKTIIAKKQPFIAKRMAIQINYKLGGSPRSLEIKFNDIMVIGYDVCHDTAYKGRSYGAMVASLDKYCIQYFSRVSEHINNNDSSNNFSLNVVNAIKKYEENNGCPPQMIFIYRDGVEHGQLPYVVSHELNYVKHKLSRLYPDILKLGFVIVSKCLKRSFEHPHGYTVVDDSITIPNSFQFFVVPQSLRQGTLSSTSYNVIYNTTQLNRYTIQDLTYKFYRMNDNWKESARLPIPCQYAHKLAHLTSHSLHRIPSSRLDTSLYYV